VAVAAHAEVAALVDPCILQLVISKGGSSRSGPVQWSSKTGVTRVVQEQVVMVTGVLLQLAHPLQHIHAQSLEGPQRHVGGI
jgi:hypothetical protein